MAPAALPGLDRRHRGALRRARLLCDYGDGLLLRGAALPRDQGRARRLYREAARGALAILSGPRTLAELLATSGALPASLRKEGAAVAAELASPPRASPGAPATLAYGALAHDLLAHLEAPRRRLRAQRARALVRGALGAAAAGILLVLAVPSLRREAFPVNLAAGKGWQASSSAPGYRASGTLADDGAEGTFFQTREEVFPWLAVDLGAPARVGAVRVANRRDCCEDRALPLQIEVSEDGRRWAPVARKRGAFSTWTASFPPVTARYVRLRADRRTALHLEAVSVY